MATFREGQDLNFAIPSNYLKALLARSGTGATRLSQGGPSISAETYFRRDLAKASLGKHFAAIADFDAVIRLESDDARTYYNRGLAKEKLGQDFAAIADFDKAIQLKPDYATVYYYRGLVKYGLDLSRLAKRDFQTALRLAMRISQPELSGYFEFSTIGFGDFDSWE